MNIPIKYLKALLICSAPVALALPAATLHLHVARATRSQAESRGTAVAYPWVFSDGNVTSRGRAVTSAEEIGRKAGYVSIPRSDAKAAWSADHLPRPSYRNLPSRSSLEAFGNSLHANEVLYGSVSWNTRSIWVNLGPKTISTATVDAYVFDVSSKKVVFKMKGVTGRSDEKSNGYKIAADVLISPLVTAVSGGPATPREQRAVQIALGRAYHTWVRS